MINVIEGDIYKFSSSWSYVTKYLFNILDMLFRVNIQILTRKKWRKQKSTASQRTAAFKLSRSISKARMSLGDSVKGHVIVAKKSTPNTSPSSVVGRSSLKTVQKK